MPAVAVEVPTPNGTLVFQPIKEGANPLELVFAFKRAHSTFRGALRLKTPTDPLALRVEENPSADFLGEAWAAALIVYAELTCVEPEDDTVVEPPAVRVVRRHQPSKAGARPTAQPIRTKRRDSRSRVTQLNSMREIVRELRSVAGHFRRLQPDAVASSDAHRAAEAAGIRLRDGYTWVRPHRRGNELFRIRWPATLQLW